MASLSALSLEYLRYQVTANVLGVPYTPTADTVQFAFPATGVAPSSWFSGSWETVGGSTYFARCLVGPSGGVVTLAAGNYDVYIKITDSPEVPVRKVGTLTVS